jgi:hypothetical protein
MTTPDASGPSLVASLRLITSGFTQPIRSAEDMYKRFIGTLEVGADKAERAGARVERAGSSFNAFLAGGAVIAGVGLLTRVISGLATEASRADVTAEIFDKTVQKYGRSAVEGRKFVQGLSDSFKVMPAVVQDSTTQLLRQGASLEQINVLFTGAGASALAFGQTAAAGFNAVTDAIITGRSNALNGIGISQDYALSLQKLARELGTTSDKLSQQERIQAAVNLITNATKEEVKDLPRLLAGAADATGELDTAMGGLRQTVGKYVLPYFIDLTRKTTDLVKGFTVFIQDGPRVAQVFGDIAGAVGILTVAIAGPTGVVAALRLATVVSGTFAAAFGAGMLADVSAVIGANGLVPALLILKSTLLGITLPAALLALPGLAALALGAWSVDMIEGTQDVEEATETATRTTVVNLSKQIAAYKALKTEVGDMKAQAMGLVLRLNYGIFPSDADRAAAVKQLADLRVKIRELEAAQKSHAAAPKVVPATQRELEAAAKSFDDLRAKIAEKELKLIPDDQLRQVTEIKKEFHDLRLEILEAAKENPKGFGPKAQGLIDRANAAEKEALRQANKEAQAQLDDLAAGVRSNSLDVRKAQAALTKGGIDDIKAGAAAELEANREKYRKLLADEKLTADQRRQLRADFQREAAAIEAKGAEEILDLQRRTAQAIRQGDLDISQARAALTRDPVDDITARVNSELVANEEATRTRLESEAQSEADRARIISQGEAKAKAIRAKGAQDTRELLDALTRDVRKGAEAVAQATAALTTDPIDDIKARTAAELAANQDAITERLRAVRAGSVEEAAILEQGRATAQAILTRGIRDEQEARAALAASVRRGDLELAKARAELSGDPVRILRANLALELQANEDSIAARLKTVRAGSAEELAVFRQGVQAALNLREQAARDELVIVRDRNNDIRNEDLRLAQSRAGLTEDPLDDIRATADAEVEAVRQKTRKKLDDEEEGSRRWKAIAAQANEEIRLIYQKAADAEVGIIEDRNKAILDLERDLATRRAALTNDPLDDIRTATGNEVAAQNDAFDRLTKGWEKDSSDYREALAKHNDIVATIRQAGARKEEDVLRAQGQAIAQLRLGNLKEEAELSRDPIRGIRAALFADLSANFDAMQAALRTVEEGSQAYLDTLTAYGEKNVATRRKYAQQEIDALTDQNLNLRRLNAEAARASAELTSDPLLKLRTARDADLATNDQELEEAKRKYERGSAEYNAAVSKAGQDRINILVNFDRAERELREQHARDVRDNQNQLAQAQASLTRDPIDDIRAGLKTQLDALTDARREELAVETLTAAEKAAITARYDALAAKARQDATRAEEDAVHARTRTVIQAELDLARRRAELSGDPIAVIRANLNAELAANREATRERLRDLDEGTAAYDQTVRDGLEADRISRANAAKAIGDIEAARDRASLDRALTLRELQAQLTEGETDDRQVALDKQVEAIRRSTLEAAKAYREGSAEYRAIVADGEQQVALVRQKAAQDELERQKSLQRGIEEVNRDIASQAAALTSDPADDLAAQLSSDKDAIRARADARRKEAAGNARAIIDINNQEKTLLALRDQQYARDSLELAERTSRALLATQQDLAQKRAALTEDPLDDLQAAHDAELTAIRQNGAERLKTVAAGSAEEAEIRRQTAEAIALAEVKYARDQVEASRRSFEERQQQALDQLSLVRDVAAALDDEAEGRRLTRRAIESEVLLREGALRRAQEEEPGNLKLIEERTRDLVRAKLQLLQQARSEVTALEATRDAYRNLFDPLSRYLALTGRKPSGAMLTYLKQQAESLAAIALASQEAGEEFDKQLAKADAATGAQAKYQDAQRAAFEDEYANIRKLARTARDGVYDPELQRRAHALAVATYEAFEGTTVEGNFAAILKGIVGGKDLDLSGAVFRTPKALEAVFKNLNKELQESPAKIKALDERIAELGREADRIEKTVLKMLQLENIGAAVDASITSVIRALDTKYMQWAQSLGPKVAAALAASLTTAQGIINGLTVGPERLAEAITTKVTSIGDTIRDAFTDSITALEGARITVAVAAVTAPAFTVGPTLGTQVAAPQATSTTVIKFVFDKSDTSGADALLRIANAVEPLITPRVIEQAERKSELRRARNLGSEDC